MSNPIRTTAPTPTLAGADYCSARVFEAERERIFHAGWFFVGHISSIPVGGRRVFEVAGEKAIVTRDEDGALHAFANVCRHRGAMLCDPTDHTELELDCGPPSIRCPYHAWTYGLDGVLLSTPRVGRDEIDRENRGLWRYRVDQWNGLVFVSLADDVGELGAWLREHSPDLFEFDDIPISELTLVQRTMSEVAANWKIIVENYQECLHCPIVHPELVDVIPVYQTGHVLDPERDDGGVELVDHGNSFSATGVAALPVLPGLVDDEEHLYRGAAVFPNLFVDVTGTGLVLTTLFPVAPDRTVVVGEYLFAPDFADSPEHDPSEVIAFNELVGRQDNVVCERVQQGVSSKSFVGGVLTDKDDLVASFNRHYLAVRGVVDPV